MAEKNPKKKQLLSVEDVTVSTFELLLETMSVLCGVSPHFVLEAGCHVFSDLLSTVTFVSLCFSCMECDEAVAVPSNIAVPQTPPPVGSTICEGMTFHGPAGIL